MRSPQSTSIEREIIMNDKDCTVINMLFIEFLEVLRREFQEVSERSNHTSRADIGVGDFFHSEVICYSPEMVSSMRDLQA